MYKRQEQDNDELVPGPLLRFYLPFTFCFIVPNLVKLAPWGWDNIKVLFYWLSLIHIWRPSTRIGEQPCQPAWANTGSEPSERGGFPSQLLRPGRGA